MEGGKEKRNKKRWKTCGAAARPARKENSNNNSNEKKTPSCRSFFLPFSSWPLVFVFFLSCALFLVFVCCFYWPASSNARSSWRCPPYGILWFSSGFTWCSWFFTAFYWVLLGYLGFYWVLLGFIGLHWVSLEFTGFCQVLNEFYRVLLGLIGFYEVLLGFT